MKHFLLCLSIHCLINSQQPVYDFTRVLPLEIATMVFEKLPYTSLDNFYQCIMMQSLSKEVFLIIQLIAQKKWHNCIQYLFDNNKYESLKCISIKSIYLPDVYKNIFISLFLEHSVQSSKKAKYYIQKMESIRKKTSQDRSLEQNLWDEMIFFTSLPSELKRRLEPFTTNNTIIFNENRNKEYMNELLFLDNDTNGLKMCIERNNFHIFEEAYNYAMKSAILSDKKYLEHDMIKLSKKLLIFAAKRGYEYIAEYIYLYLKSLLLVDLSLFDISMFFNTITSKILSSGNQGDSIVEFIFQDLDDSFRQQDI